MDTYFVLEVMKRVKYRTGGREEWDNWGNVTRLVPINRFGSLIIDKENADSIEEMKIIPAWLDEISCKSSADPSSLEVSLDAADIARSETDDTIGLVPFLECGETGEGDNAYSNQSHSGRPHGSEKVDQDVPIQFGALPTDSAGKREKGSAVFDKLFVAFWWGDYSKCTPRLPHPWIDTMEFAYSWFDLSTFSSYEDFIAACRWLHRDESDPEFAYLDFENYPSQWYSESCMDEDTFERIQEFAELDSDEQEAFKAFLDVTCDSDASFDDFRERYCGQWDSEEAFAEHLCDELCMFDNVPESVSRFFDYSAFARELFLSDYDMGDDGHVFRTC